MKYIIVFLIGFSVNLSHAVDWVSKTYSTVTIKDTTELPDGSIYSNFEQTGQGNSNLGKYVISNCSGNRLDKKGKLFEGIWLIGYDGNIKGYTKDNTLLFNLHNLIDDMSIRKKEMKELKTNC